MAKITAQPTIDMTVTFSVSEAEARALDGLVGYGDDAFIATFKDQLGSAYIRNHEAALREGHALQLRDPQRSRSRHLRNP